VISDSPIEETITTPGPGHKNPTEKRKEKNG
jgi:hypothetical protein